MRDDFNSVDGHPVSAASGVVVFRRGAGHRPLAIVETGGTAVAIVWPGSGAEWRSLHRIELESGGRTVVLRHPAEAVYYLKSGTVEITDAGGGEGLALATGSMVHIGPEQPYRFQATSAAELIGGACPPDPALYGEHPVDDARVDAVGDITKIRIFHPDRPTHVVPLISSDARLVVSPAVGANTANMNYVVLAPGEANTPHSHARSEDTIYILEGRGSVDDLTNNVRRVFEAGDIVHVPAGVRHAVSASLGERIVSVGGPCPPDTALLGHAIAVSSGAAPDVVLD